MADTSKPALNVKRKRRAAGECPNPLFVRWVEEWRDEAREDGSKVQYAYAKVHVPRIVSWYGVYETSRAGIEFTEEVPTATHQWTRGENTGSYRYTNSCRVSLTYIHNSGGDTHSLVTVYSIYVCEGEKLAKKLDKRLAEHRAAAGGDPPPITGYGRDAPASGENSGCVKKSKLDPEKEVDTCESATRVSNKGKVRLCSI